VTSVGSATTNQRAEQFPDHETDVIVSTGGMSIFLDITSGETRSFDQVNHDTSSSQ